MTIAFDFDGALVDSFTPLYTINDLAAQHVGRTITEAQYRDAFKGPIHVELKRLLTLDDNEDTEFRRFKRNVFARHYNETTVKPHAYVEPLLRELVFAGHHLVIVTAAPAEEVDRLLSHYGLYGRFRHVLGGNVAGKRDVLESLLRKGDAFVTDTAGDVREALTPKELPFDTIGVTWGFHDTATLLEAEAKHVVNEPEALRLRLTGEPTPPR